MNEITLSGKEWRNPDNVWDDLLRALGAPAWHGRNLDALSDGIGGGSINHLEPPFRIVVQDVADAPKSVVFLLHRIKKLISEIKTEGIAVELGFPGGTPPGWDYISRPDALGHMRVLDLLREWDPIGVYGPGSTWTDDEYDGYAPAVMALLDQGVASREIAHHLSCIAESHMALSGTEQQRHRHLATAERLVDFWSQWKTERSS